MNKIKQLLNNNEENHLMPFLWMHGEDESTIRHYIKTISKTGIKAVCIESRPHPNFVKEQWWEDVRIIIDECKKNGMKLWILDDAHFPTGYAAGEIENYPELQKQFLKIKHYDFVGPMNNAGLMLEWSKVGKRPNILADEAINLDETDDKIIGVVAAKKTEYNDIDPATLTNITANVINDTLYWDVPEGEWSIFVLVNTYKGGEESTKGYLNPIDKKATQILIDTVYETHYAHFKEEFGETILGFFSDEPRFGNIKGPEAILGTVDMDYPWSADLLALLADKMNVSELELIEKLPLLQIGNGQEAQSIRFNYMELVSELFSENFSEVLGEWCSDHEVEYIGHVIEDNNAHARLGYGAGHFFKSLSGQHMSGIDVVLHQLMPDFNNGKFKSMTSTGWDGEFFTYGLAKMGSSLGYLDSKKKGRTMCEVFGAYGWNEGLPLMKYIIDHMLSSGVNYFVPHSFTMSPYPDPDCPPHLYAYGNNPQFKYTHRLMNYINRISTLISDGKHLSDIAVLYHAEGEWAGESMLSQKVMRELIQNQIEFDVVDNSMINSSKNHSGGFEVNGYVFNTLIVPYTERITDEFLQSIIRLKNNGVELIFIDGLPASKVEGEFNDDELKTINNFEVVELTKIAEKVGETSNYSLRLENEIPHLRYFHYEQNDQEIILLFNESMNKRVSTKIDLDSIDKFVVYDAFSNEIHPIKEYDGKLDLNLDYGEMIVLISNSDVSIDKENTLYNQALEMKNWEITFDSFKSSKGYPALSSETLPIFGLGDEYEDFVGYVNYRTNIPNDIHEAELYIDGANEVTEVYLNDKLVGDRISSPHIYDLAPYLQSDKENILEIKVLNNLGRRNRDFLSQYILFSPIGISKKVELRYNN